MHQILHHATARLGSMALSASKTAVYGTIYAVVVCLSVRHKPALYQNS